MVVINQHPCIIMYVDIHMEYERDIIFLVVYSWYINDGMMWGYTGRLIYMLELFYFLFTDMYIYIFVYISIYVYIYVYIYT